MNKEQTSLPAFPHCLLRSAYLNLVGGIRLERMTFCL